MFKKLKAYLGIGKYGNGPNIIKPTIFKKQEMTKPCFGFKPRSTNLPKRGDETKYVAAHTTKTNPTKIGVKLNCKKF